MIDVETRWNSTFKMLKSLLAYKAFCCSQVEAALNLREPEWKLIEEMSTILEPVYIATLKLQEEQLFLSDFYKIWLNMKLDVQQKSNSSVLLSCLEHRESMILENPSVLSALYIDPRLRCVILKEPLKVMCARSHLKETMTCIIALEEQVSFQPYFSFSEHDLVFFHFRLTIHQATYDSR